MTKPGKQLANFLRRKGLTQRQAAAMFGTGQAVIWRWCVGRAKPGPVSQAAILARLGFRWPE